MWFRAGVMGAHLMNRLHVYPVGVPQGPGRAGSDGETRVFFNGYYCPAQCLLEAWQAYQNHGRMFSLGDGFSLRVDITDDVCILKSVPHLPSLVGWGSTGQTPRVVNKICGQCEYLELTETRAPKSWV